MRRLGYVRLRDYNLRATADGMLVPISSDRPVLMDLAHPALVAPPPPRRARPESWPRPVQLAEGTFDGLEKVEPPLLAPFDIEDEEDELPYRPWTED